MTNHSDILLTNFGLPNSETLLSDWLTFSGSYSDDPITEKSRIFFKHFWSTWNQYLEKSRVGEGDPGYTPDTRWSFAQKEDVARFLVNGPRIRKTGTTVSDITRRRYWRLLERIYGYAARRGYIASSPVAPLEETDVPTQEDPKAAIVQPAVWKAAHGMVNTMVLDEPRHYRNKAILLLLMEHGPVPQEVRNAGVQDVLRDEAGAITHLQVDGPGPRQRRRLQLSADTAMALEEWLGVRNVLPVSHATPALFCSTTSAGALDPDTLLKLVTELLLAASKMVNQPPPARLGPQVIRNTRQVLWLNAGNPAAQVAVWAGLKDAKGFRHLREVVNPEVRPYVMGAARPNGADTVPVASAVPRANGRRPPVQGTLFD